MRSTCSKWCLALFGSNWPCKKQWSGDSPGSFYEYRLSAGWPSTLRPSQPTWALRLPVNGCYHPNPSSPFVIVTQRKNWYSFYHPMEVGRLSQPRHCSTGVLPMCKAVLSRWLSWWTRLQARMLTLDHCDQQRQMGVNNLHEVVTRQRGGRESNSQPLSCESNTLTTRRPSHQDGINQCSLWSNCCFMYRRS